MQIQSQSGGGQEIRTKNNSFDGLIKLVHSKFQIFAQKIFIFNFFFFSSECLVN